MPLMWMFSTLMIILLLLIVMDFFYYKLLYTFMFKQNKIMKSVNFNFKW